MEFHDRTVVRLNLAWIDSLEFLQDELSRIPNDIFLDLPTGRTKPPNNKYTLEDLKPILQSFDNVKFLAISNVEGSSQVTDVYNRIGTPVNLVPKIESKKGIENLGEICKSLRGDKILMLDHDDLFADLSKRKIANNKYIDYILKVSQFCESNGVSLLKTRGVIFSDSDGYNFK